MRKTIRTANVIACFRAAAAHIKPEQLADSPDLYIACLVGALEDESQELANALYAASGQRLRDDAKWAAKDKALSEGRYSRVQTDEDSSKGAA